jgi:hypothetical protein
MCLRDIRAVRITIHTTRISAPNINQLAGFRITPTV